MFHLKSFMFFFGFFAVQQKLSYQPLHVSMRLRIQKYYLLDKTCNINFFFFLISLERLSFNKIVSLFSCAGPLLTQDKAYFRTMCRCSHSKPSKIQNNANLQQKKNSGNVIYSRKQEKYVSGIQEGSLEEVMFSRFCDHSSF